PEIIRHKETGDDDAALQVQRLAKHIAVGHPKRAMKHTKKQFAMSCGRQDGLVCQRLETFNRAHDRPAQAMYSIPGRIGSCRHKPQQSITTRLGSLGFRTQAGVAWNSSRAEAITI